LRLAATRRGFGCFRIGRNFGFFSEGWRVFLRCCGGSFNVGSSGNRGGRGRNRGSHNRDGRGRCSGHGAGATAAWGGASATAVRGLTTTGCSAVRGWSSRDAGATGGLATTATCGGATTTAGRVAVTAPTGALATTGPVGGREAMAGGAGGATTMGGAERGWGTILRVPDARALPAARLPLQVVPRA